MKQPKKQSLTLDDYKSTISHCLRFVVFYNSKLRVTSITTKTTKHLSIILDGDFTQLFPILQPVSAEHVAMTQVLGVDHFYLPGN